MFKKRRRPANARQIDEEPRGARPADPAKARTRTIQRAVKLLAAKPRSIGELRERLLEKEWATEEAVDAAIEKLREYGYLDDERFAVSFAASRVRQSAVGAKRLARDLANKKVPRETAEEALRSVFAETPQEQLIDRAIEKRIRLRGRPQSREDTKKLFDHLLRQGFPPDLVISKVRALSAPDVDEEADDATT